jgi:tripeptide aminopeptidase
MQERFLPDLEDRFLRYVQIDTQSEEASSTVPTTAKQFVLLRQLFRELDELGAQDVSMSEHGYVLATIPGNRPAAPVVALFAHVDTTESFPGANVKPIVHRAYDGQPIALPDDPRQVLNRENSPDLFGKVGEDIVTASGTTLLGADDKSGVAVIMTVAAELLANPDLPHGEIRICFNCDEEVGRGVDHLDLNVLRADVGYTLDGGHLGEITYETFSADKAVVRITGVATHPGYATGKQVNALPLAAQLLASLPQDSHTPATTEGNEGFLHPYHIAGNAAEVELHFILRDFELQGLDELGNLLREACEALAAPEPRARVNLKIAPQYRNMRYWLEEDMRPVALAVAAIEDAGIEPIMTPVRGGTDGSRLTEKGLPTPNLFTGMQNFHGPLEWISLQDMARATEVCLNLVARWAEEAA